MDQAVPLMEIDRRKFLGSSTAAAMMPQRLVTRTQFQVACMTLPYSAFPLERALTGIRGAGYEYVAWGVSHQGKPVLGVDAPAAEATRLGKRCREMGLEPVMMFSTVHLEAAE